MISVVIATSPGRQDYLGYCLNALTRQHFQDFEVIVADDGSEGMEPVISAFQGCFRRLEYFWRPPDHNLSRSRNRGAAAALGEQLVFLNTDVLLNPAALGAYHNTLKQHPQATCWGYVGCRKRVSAPSIWFPSQQVNWLDFRFFPLGPEELVLHPELYFAPYRLAGGHQFAMTQATYHQIGPLNEEFVAWGEEDVEYALRGLIKQHAMIFLGDAWAEHLAHAYAEAFHAEAASQQAGKLAALAELEQQLAVSPWPRAVVLFDQQLPLLWQQIASHYLPHQPEALQDELQG